MSISAEVLYTSRKKEIDKKIEHLQYLLVNHEDSFKRSEGHYGYPGDLGRILECLNEAIGNL